MTLNEKYNRLGNAICPICKTAICFKNSCHSEYHKNYKDLQILLNIEAMTQSELKTHVEKIKKSPIKRLSAPSPDFFVTVQKWCIFIGIASGSLSAYFLGLNAESKIGLVLASLGGFVATIGTILAKLPVDEKKVVDKLSK